MDLHLSSNNDKKKKGEKKDMTLRMLVPGTRHLANREESKVVWLAKNIGM